jgi:DNA-binding beta-propeller fold protein YncE
VRPTLAIPLALALIAVLAGPAAAAGDGSLTRLKGRAGCLSVGGTHGCSPARGLGDPRAVEVTPGGGSVYVASARALAVFRRNPLTGALTQLSGRAGCVRARRTARCAGARGLRGARAIAASGNGRYVYVAAGASGGAIVVFRRNRRTGALRRLRGRAGCVAQHGGGVCRDGRALADPSSLALGPNGRVLYAGSHRGAIAVLRRNRRTGRIRQLGGADGCVTASGLGGCATGRGLNNVIDLAIDGDGRNLYASSFGSNAVAAFDRRSGGSLGQLPGAAGCIAEDGLSDGCAPARTLLGAFGLAFAPGGGNLYAAASLKAAVATLLRDPATGALTQPPGPAGCIRDSGGFGCAVARRMTSPEAIEVSGDGRNAYLTTSEDGSLVVLGRNGTTGELSQLPGKAGCLASPPVSDCASSQGLRGPVDVALSRDLRNAYVLWGESDAIGVYGRAR